MDPVTMGYEVCKTMEADAAVGYTAFIPGTSGNVTIHDKRGNVTTFPVVAGQLYPIYVARLGSATTTATGIVGLA